MDHVTLIYNKYYFFYKKECIQDIYPMIPFDNIMVKRLYEMTSLTICAKDNNIELLVLKDRYEYFTEIMDNIPFMIRNHKLQKLLSN